MGLKVSEELAAQRSAAQRTGRAEECVAVGFFLDPQGRGGRSSGSNIQHACVQVHGNRIDGNSGGGGASSRMDPGAGWGRVSCLVLFCLHCSAVQCGAGLVCEVGT